MNTVGAGNIRHGAPFTRDYMTKKTTFNRLFSKHLKDLRDRTGMTQDTIGESIGGTRNICQNGQRNQRAVGMPALEKFIKLTQMSKEDSEEILDAWFEERIEFIKNWGQPFSAFISDCRAGSSDDAKFLKAYRKLRDKMIGHFE